jgi:hypothetical protein
MGDTNTTIQPCLNGKNSSAKKFTKREIYFYNRIVNFYNQCSKNDMVKVIDIINGTSLISLRILDWFATKYSNKNKILIMIKDDVLDVHISYKAQLKSYKKKYFDPFKRHDKFEYHFKGTDTTIQTTIGQLNFFRWAMENGIVKYIEDNYEKLSKEMNLSNKDDKKRKREKLIVKTMDKINTKIKRSSNKKNIGINITKKLENNKQFKIILTFD